MTPSISDLIMAPQIAALQMLDSVLDIATNAITAAHADVLWDQLPGLAFEHSYDHAIIRAAEEILEIAENLRGAIAIYCLDLTPHRDTGQVALDLEIRAISPSDCHWVPP